MTTVTHTAADDNLIWFDATNYTNAVDAFDAAKSLQKRSGEKEVVVWVQSGDLDGGAPRRIEICRVTKAKDSEEPTLRMTCREPSSWILAKRIVCIFQNTPRSVTAAKQPTEASEPTPIIVIHEPLRTGKFKQVFSLGRFD